jgi:hypothetical protein
MAKKKKEEEVVEVSLIHKIPDHRYFLATYISNFNTAKDLYHASAFIEVMDRNSEPVFRILAVLDGPEIPDGLASGDYFVIKTVRKFEVTAHVPDTIYSTKELKLG